MEKTIELVILSNEKEIFNGKIKEIETETDQGPVKVMPLHEPYISQILNKISYTEQDGTTHEEKINEGFLYTNGIVCFIVI
jgi:F0F1-type ATP synthase epsilon subunit